MATATVLLNGEFHCCHSAEDEETVMALAQHHAESLRKRGTRRAEMLKIKDLTCVEIHLGGVRRRAKHGARASV